MPKTITDQEWNYLQQRRQVADFSDSIFNDPTLNKDAKRLIKRKYPNIPMPDIDIEDNVENKLAADRQEREAEKQAERDRLDTEEFKKKRDSTQKKYGFTDEAMTRLEKLMLDEKIGSYDAAATYMASKEPPPSSDPTYDPSRWHHERTNDFEQISKDPEAWGRDQIMQALLRDQQAAKGGR